MSHLNPIYAVWDNNAEAMATAIGEPGVKVRQWRNRGNIPSSYWQRIIDEAARLGVTLTWNQFTRPRQSVLICSVCDLRAEQPEAQSCTAPNCGLNQRKVA